MEHRRSATSKTFGQRRFSDNGRTGTATSRAPRYGQYSNQEEKGPRANNRPPGGYGKPSKPGEKNGNVKQKFSRDKQNPGYYADRKAKMPPSVRAAGKAAGPWKKADNVKITSEMQITDGKLRGKMLESVPLTKNRVTSRRLREVMFRILSRRVRARRFLDLCSGPGIMGLEAVSRGAMVATFVERSARMCTYIKKNMESCGVREGHGEVYEAEMVPFLKRNAKRKRFWDVVYFDPPYDSDYDEALKYFDDGSIVAPGGILLIEHHSEMFFPETIGPLRRRRVVVQGDSALSFYERKL